MICLVVIAYGLKSQGVAWHIATDVRLPFGLLTLFVLTGTRCVVVDVVSAVIGTWNMASAKMQALVSLQVLLHAASLAFSVVL